LKSLHPYHDEDEEGSRSERGSLSISKTSSRSTIKGDLERHLKPTFNDVNGQINSHTSSSDDQAATNPYAPWGGYRKCIAQFLDDIREPAISKNEMSAGVLIPRQLFPVVPIPPNGDDYGTVLQ